MIFEGHDTTNTTDNKCTETHLSKIYQTLKVLILCISRYTGGNKLGRSRHVVCSRRLNFQRLILPLSFGWSKVRNSFGSNVTAVVEGEIHRSFTNFVARSI